MLSFYKNYLQPGKYCAGFNLLPGEVFGPNVKHGYPRLLLVGLSADFHREYKLNPQLRNMRGSATRFSLLVLGPRVAWELTAEQHSWKAAGLNVDENLGRSTGASVSVGILLIKAVKK